MEVHQARNSSRRGNKIPFRRRIDSSKPTCRQNRCCKNGSDHRFRFAVVGSLTRRGGVIRHASGGATTGGLQVARVGDKVVYADGSESTIISGAGKARIMQGASAALVGSMLDNGDEIISTPQSCSKLVFREGRELPEGFLTVSGSKH
ncbi:PAAR domain-containing protein [Klebsiella pneumoniae]|uniref:PAAR domain-containing protein n=1 Tax=Klebsiella pneumoniae TaxID=573 RepID=UPI001CD738D7|nr:PAAR domain-containing protein [Klebsiella pneumoniae]